MPVQLTPRAIAKPWGMARLPATVPAALADCAADIAGAEAAAGALGEIWFDGDGDAALRVKWLFTGERLSVQVHPDDAAARAVGVDHGKDEAWYVVAADRGAVIGLGIAGGPAGAPPRDAVAAAARDGSILAMMEWREVVAGDVLYVPGGTIHALGGGLEIIEIQQALDLTWRLYDYGRPRQLDLDRGVAAARLSPFGANAVGRPLGAARLLRSDGGKFVVEEIAGPWSGSIAGDRGDVWVVALAGTGQLGEASVAPGTVWRIDAATPAALGPAGRWLLAYAGPAADMARLA